MDIGLRARSAHTVAIPELEIELTLEDGEQLRVEVSAKFRREGVEAELMAAGLCLDAWWVDRAGDFAVLLATKDGGAAGS